MTTWGLQHTVDCYVSSAYCNLQLPCPCRPPPTFSPTPSSSCTPSLPLPGPLTLLSCSSISLPPPPLSVSKELGHFSYRVTVSILLTVSPHCPWQAQWSFVLPADRPWDLEATRCACNLFGRSTCEVGLYKSLRGLRRLVASFGDISSRPFTITTWVPHCIGSWQNIWLRCLLLLPHWWAGLLWQHDRLLCASSTPWLCQDIFMQAKWNTSLPSWFPPPFSVFSGFSNTSELPSIVWS